MMDVKNEFLISNLRSEMERSGFNARELADKAAVGRSFIYDILNGRSKNPTTTKMAAIAEVLGVSLSHLTFSPEEVLPENGFAEIAGSYKYDDFVSVPCVEMLVSGEANDTPAPLFLEKVVQEPSYFRRSWVRGLQCMEEDLRVICVKGDSMSPTVEGKDKVLLDLSQTSPTPPGLFALHDGMGVLVRRLQYITHPKKPKVRVISDNVQYKTIEQPLADVHIIGRVVWLCREL